MKKLIYISNTRIPNEKAHGLAIMKMCEAFAKSGYIVELVVSKRMADTGQDPFVYYGVLRNFRITRLPCMDLVRYGRFGFFIQAGTFAMSAFWYLLAQRVDLYYGRDDWSLSILSLFKKNVVWEAHTKKSKWKVYVLLKRINKMVVISGGLAQYYTSLGVPNEKVLLAPSGVDIEQFERVTNSRRELREELALPTNKKIVAYVGKFKTMGQEKGVRELVDAFDEGFRDNQEVFLMVVGSDSKEREMILGGRGVVMPAVPPSMLPKYMKVADVLVANYPNMDHYAHYMSPLKIFEYMASGTPIVASDLPSIREVLDEESAVLVDPNDVRALTAAVRRILDDVSLANDLSVHASKKVSRYTWLSRADNVLSFIS